MALSPMYAAILQDLNKAVAMHQPEDVLQFCANFVSSPRRAAARWLALSLLCVLVSCPCPLSMRKGAARLFLKEKVSQ